MNKYKAVCTYKDGRTFEKELEAENMSTAHFYIGAYCAINGMSNEFKEFTLPISVSIQLIGSPFESILV